MVFVVVIFGWVVGLVVVVVASIVLVISPMVLVIIIPLVVVIMVTLKCNRASMSVMKNEAPLNAATSVRTQFKNSKTIIDRGAECEKSTNKRSIKMTRNN